MTNDDEGRTPAQEGGTQGSAAKTTRASKDASGQGARVVRGAVRYVVADRRTKTLTLRAPGPRGKVAMSVSFRVNSRYVEIPDKAATTFAAHIAELVSAGVLVAPAPPAPELKPIVKKAG